METILDRLELTEKEYGSRPAVDDGSVRDPEREDQHEGACGDPG